MTALFASRLCPKSPPTHSTIGDGVYVGSDPPKVTWSGKQTPVGWGCRRATRSGGGS
jgi:hypothetical protein